MLGVDKGDRLRIEFRVKERASPTMVVGKLEVKDADPAGVVHFSLRAIPPGMTAADMSMKIDPATRARLINGAVASLNEFYVFPEVAKKMEQALRARQKRGEYDVVEDAEALAELLRRAGAEVELHWSPGAHGLERADLAAAAAWWQAGVLK